MKPGTHIATGMLAKVFDAAVAAMLAASLVLPASPAAVAQASPPRRVKASRPMVPRIAPPQPSAEPLGIIAKPKRGVSLKSAVAAAGRKGQTIARGRAVSLDIPEGETVEEEIDDLMDTGKFEYVEPDYELFPLSYTSYPNDPAFNDMEAQTTSDGIFSPARSWHLRGPGSPGFSELWPKLEMNGALYQARADGEDFPIAVIDTGYWLDQEDRGNIVGKFDFCETYSTSGVRTTDDDVTPATPNGELVPDASTSHGTHVAGLIASRGNNGIGTIGAAYDPTVYVYKIQGVRADGTYEGQAVMPGSALVDAIYRATDDGAKVISMSVGMFNQTEAAQEAIDYAHDHGVLLIAASGNYNVGTVTYPAAYDHVMAVGAYTLPNGDMSPPARWVSSTRPGSGSSFGPGLDIMAPGVAVYGPLTPGKDYSGEGTDRGYWFMTGTSMATPLVSAAASMIWRFAPFLSADEVEGILKATADDMDSAGYDQYTGWGKLDALGAYDYLKTNYPALRTPELSGVVQGELRQSSDLSLSWSACPGQSVTYDVRGDWLEESLYSGPDTGVFLTNIPDGERTVTVMPKSPANWSDTSTVASVGFRVSTGRIPVIVLDATSSVTAVHYGDSVNLSGVLTSDGFPVRWTPIHLERSTDGGGTWSSLADPVTGSTGAWAYTHKPGRNTVYRASYEGTSQLLTVKQYPYVGTPTMSTTRPYRGRSYTVYGSLKPRFTSGSYPVYVRFYRKSSSTGKYVWRRTYSGKAYDYSSYSRYKTTYRFPDKGWWKIETTSKGTSAFSPVKSSARYVYVR